jgi:Ni,Fe-hydrogenase I large subunit
LLAIAHYLEALEWQKDFIRIHAVLGGKRRSPPAVVPRRRYVHRNATPTNQPATITPDRIDSIRDLVLGAKKFVEDYYIPDVMAIAPYYKNWFTLGEGLGNFLCYGDYSSGDQNDPENIPLPARHRPRSRPDQSLPVDPWEDPPESVAHSWYEYSGGDTNGLHPSVGETNPKYSGTKAPFDHLDVDKKYSWLKAPRYDGKPMEVGARSLVWS